MAITLIVYRFDKHPESDDILFYMGHIPKYSDTAFDGVVLECRSAGNRPPYTVFRVVDSQHTSDTFFVLFVMNQTTEPLEGCVLEASFLYEDQIAEEISEWMLLTKTNHVKPSLLSNGNILFELDGDQSYIDRNFEGLRLNNLAAI